MEKGEGKIMAEVIKLQSEITELKEVVNKILELSTPKTTQSNSNRIPLELVDDVINYFNKVHGKNFRRTSKATEAIRGRLKSFNIDEIKEAIRGYKHTAEDNPDFWKGKNYESNLHTLMRNDAKIETWMMYERDRSQKNKSEMRPLTYD